MQTAITIKQYFVPFTWLKSAGHIFLEIKCVSNYLMVKIQLKVKILSLFTPVVPNLYDFMEVKS